MPQPPQRNLRNRLGRITRRWLRAVTVLAVLVIACSQFGRVHYFFDVLSNFQVQFFGASVVLTMSLLALRSWRFAILSFGGVVLTGWHVVPWYLPQGQREISGQPLRVMLFNVYQLNERFADVLRTIQREAPDLIVVQEAHETWYEQLQSLTSSHPYSLHVPGSIMRGMAVFSKYPIENLRTEPFNNYDSQSIAGTVVVNGHRLSLLTCHPWPPIREEVFEHRNEQLALTARACALLPQPAILIGDLNTTMWSPFYRDFERVSGLHNARRGFGIVPTHPMNELPLLRIPIDHVLVSDGVAVKDCRRGDPSGSDHAPLIVDLFLK